ncbi:Neurogenic locus notch -like protein 1 [Trichinella pseudospiralis]|uniref:Neurogenic locus notch-like protein 1 n=1 Tax=Trichinella pseudospiralis TaxID=6337 RepID=A0A0V1FIZ6_TRIPS|nr:Neurogenic locus notch -like protein 1 [Trichinella pseudospiralis]
MKLLKALLIFIFSISSVAHDDCLFNNDYVQVGNQLIFPIKHMQQEDCYAWVQISRRDELYNSFDFQAHSCETALPQAADFSHKPNVVYNLEDVIIPRETLNRLFKQSMPAFYMTGLYYRKNFNSVAIHYRGRKSIVTRGKVKEYVKALVYMEPVLMKTNLLVHVEVIHAKMENAHPFPIIMYGFNCDTEINVCENVTCIHGKCISHLYENGSYAAYCDCSEGYTGSDCTTDINECSDTGNPVCLNNGKCVNEIGTYKCICPIGFDGRNCEFETDMCTPNPCHNNASCVIKGQQKDEFECLCSDIFTGKTCETRIDFCEGITCMHGGTCSNLNEGGYECLCNQMLSGKHCEKVLMCEEISCNFGVCKYSVDENRVFCDCINGYTGKYCNWDINECTYQEKPCKNNGTCVNTFGSYKCECPKNFEGTHCEIKIDPCGSNPCSNQATCITLKYECQCQIGFEGRLCEIKIDYCKNVTCANGGECINMDDNNYICKCKTGFSGIHCEEIRVCDFVSCVHGTCKYNLFENGDYVSFCDCNPGFQGNDCSIDIDECTDKGNYPCLNNGTCFNDVGSYHCQCSIKFEGVHCEKKIDPCGSNPCSNQATCITLSDDPKEYECQCQIGFEGRLCEIKIDYCKNVTCANGGECINMDDNNYICKCKTGFSGIHCEEIRVCDLVSCVHGTCKYNLFENGDYVSFCDCNPGFQGNDCSIDIDECADEGNYPCLNNGTCFNDVGSYHCQCSIKFEGVHCEKKFDPCRSNHCQNQATCVDLDNEINAYECSCKPGFTGKLCETKIDFCKNVTCYFGGECVNLEGDEVGYACKCKVGFSGNHCEKVEICKIAGCVHGNCTYELFCDGEYHYRCECDEGFEGNDCSTDIEPCLINPCKNGATCIVYDYGLYVDHHCQCPNGYIGESCEIIKHPCPGKFCTEQISSCLYPDTVDDSQCTLCPIGYVGYNCETEIDGCLKVECLNGGTCFSTGLNTFHCNCPKGFYGKYCEKNDLCLGVNCGTGYCSYTLDGGYECICHDGPCLGDNICFGTVCPNDTVCIGDLDYHACYRKPGHDRIKRKPNEYSSLIDEVKVTLLCLFGSLVFFSLVMYFHSR